MMSFEVYRIVKHTLEELLKEREITSSKEEYLSVEQVADELNLKVSRVRTAIFSNEIPYVKIGNLVRVPRRQLHLYLEANLRLPNSQGRC